MNFLLRSESKVRRYWRIVARIARKHSSTTNPSQRPCNS